MSTRKFRSFTPSIIRIPSGSLRSCERHNTGRHFDRRGADSMCPVSFTSHSSGYYVGMNRDERFSRHAALPPRVFDSNTPHAVYPFEPNGGTWIAVNDTGIAFALINRNISVGYEQKRSRGEIIPALVHSSLPAIEERLMMLPLTGTLPFLLIVIAFPQRKLCESLWDGSELQKC